MSEWTDTIDALIDYLRYHQECGGGSIELDPAVLQTLRSATSRPAAAPSTPPSPPLVAPVTPAPVPVAPPLRLPRPEGDALAARQAGLEQIASIVAVCQRCTLGQSRMRTVPGQGNPCSPEIVFIGETPGAEEDAQGLAFVGAAGQLLTKMIGAMGFSREQVFITNICKCHPPGNRQPTLDEMQACIPYLHAQLAIIRPKTIVALGPIAVKGLLDTQVGISRRRGQWTRYGNVPLMPTLHPTHLLRYPVAKKDSWGDLKAVLKQLGRQVPAPVPLAAASPVALPPVSPVLRTPLTSDL